MIALSYFSYVFDNGETTRSLFDLMFNDNKNSGTAILWNNPRITAYATFPPCQETEKVLYAWVESNGVVKK